MIQHTGSHLRSLFQAQEETVKQERCAHRGRVGNGATCVLKLKEKDKATFLSPSEVWSLQAPSITKSHLPEWLFEFTENLTDDSVPEHRDAPASIFREPLHQERSIKVVSGKHRIFIHLPKDQNCGVCKRTKITRAPCRKRTGTVVPRAVFL